jgi:hypothetical protein
MTRKAEKKPAPIGEKPKTVFEKDPDTLNGAMKCVGGSRSDHWNETLANQAISTLWTAHSKDEILNRQYNAVVAALAGAEPRDVGLGGVEHHEVNHATAPTPFPPRGGTAGAPGFLNLSQSDDRPER